MDIPRLWKTLIDYFYWLNALNRLKANQSTYLKGDVLEAKTFDVFKNLLENEQLYIQGKCSKIFRKKKYWSGDRQADITFDLSIETTIPGESETSLLTLFECKNYDSSVQVGDVEAFSDRVRQVGGHKGIMITTSPFQKSALQIARARKIGVARITAENEISWILKRVDEGDLQGIIASFDEWMSAERYTDSAVLGGYDGYLFTSLLDLCFYFGIIDHKLLPLKLLSIPYKTDDEMEERIAQLAIENCYDYFSLNTDALCRRISELYDANFVFSEPLNRNLGRIEFDPLTVYIEPGLKTELKRWRFTLVHEIGHLVLHSSILKEYMAVTNEDQSLQILSPGTPRDIVKRMEIQANRFASLVLMPTGYFKKAVEKYFKRESINKGFLYLDNQPVNIKLVMTLLAELESIFGISKEAAKVRLKDLGLLKDNQDTSFNTHMRKGGFG